MAEPQATSLCRIDRSAIQAQLTLGIDDLKLILRPLPPGLSLLWLWIKIALYLVLSLNAVEAVVVAYQQF
ncbi:MAG: hypothetical protein A2516_08655 [Alphaproteobacteria bacterium RIFOXYD12_FULL_60_8]|nr:MAG: hypothetical protein A2516_08655 [Alphaproteobacteria bacterium RIFOXYD12_FULL_60_8]